MKKFLAGLALGLLVGLAFKVEHRIVVDAGSPDWDRIIAEADRLRGKPGRTMDDVLYGRVGPWAMTKVPHG